MILLLNKKHTQPDIATNTDLKAFRLSVISMFFLSAVSQAQDVLADLPTLPMGFTDAPLGFSQAPSGFTQDDSAFAPGPTQQDFTMNGSVTLAYNSNVRQGIAGEGNSSSGDLTLSPRVGFNYLRRRDQWQLGVNAGGSYRFNFDNDDLDGFNGSIGFFGGYQSTKVVASFSTNFSSSSGVNQISGGFLEQISYSNSLVASYRFSGRTSLMASWNRSANYTQTSGFDDTSSSTFNLSAVWQATPLINIGPGIRYSRREGESGDVTSIGPSLSVNYDLSDRVKLRSSIGANYGELPSGEDTEFVNWSLSMNYRPPSALWNLNLSMIQDYQSTFVEGGGFDEVTSYQLGWGRKIRRANVGLSLAYRVTDPQETPLSVDNGRDSDFFSINATLGMRVFRDEVTFNTGISWQDQSASNQNYSYDGFQYRASLTWQF